MRKHLLFAFLLLTLFVLRPHVTLADTLNVNASVPYTIPTIPAVITAPTSGVSETATAQLTGTCEFVAPATIVSIWRGGVRIGNAACSVVGSFDVAVSLVAGDNALTPRTSNLSDVFGPDGVPITLSYTPPYVPPPATPSSSPSSSGSQGGQPALTVQQPFAILSEDNTTITITIGINGGFTPYTLNLNWGDGATETVSLAEPGTYTFSHMYEKADTYTIIARVTDVEGAETIYQIPAVTSEKSQSQDSSNIADLTVVKRGPSSLPYVVVVTVIVGLVATSFWAGEHFQLGRKGHRPSSRRKK